MWNSVARYLIIALLTVLPKTTRYQIYLTFHCGNELMPPPHFRRHFDFPVNLKQKGVVTHEGEEFLVSVFDLSGQICLMDKLTGIISKDNNSNMVARGGDRTLVRCCIVGDALVGKTQAVKAFTGAECREYTPTIFENYAGVVTHEGEEFLVSVFDLSGQHDHEELRAFAYTDSQACIMCYSAIDRISFQNVKEFWVPEIHKHAHRKRPIIVVATQCNLRDTTTYDSDVPVSIHEGEALAKDIGAECFLEISNIAEDSPDSVFRQVVIQTQKQKKKRSRSIKIIHKILGKA